MVSANKNVTIKLTLQHGNGEPRVKGEKPDLTSHDDHPHSVNAARLSVVVREVHERSWLRQPRDRGDTTELFVREGGRWRKRKTAKRRR